MYLIRVLLVRCVAAAAAQVEEDWKEGFTAATAAELAQWKAH